LGLIAPYFFELTQNLINKTMDLQQIVTLIKVKKKHGLIKRVSEATGVSQPSVRKYLNGDIINPKAMSVIKAALEEVNNAS
jgi:response regulator of citrate/malate metabolism